MHQSLRFPTRFLVGVFTTALAAFGHPSSTPVHNHLETRELRATYTMSVREAYPLEIVVHIRLVHRESRSGKPDIWHYVVEVDQSMLPLAQRQAISLPNLGIQSPTHAVDLVVSHPRNGWPMDYKIYAAKGTGMAWQTLEDLIRNGGGDPLTDPYTIPAFSNVGEVVLIESSSDQFSVFVEVHERKHHATIGLDPKLEAKSAQPIMMMTGHDNVPPPIPPGGSGSNR